MVVSYVICLVANESGRRHRRPRADDDQETDDSGRPVKRAKVAHNQTLEEVCESHVRQAPHAQDDDEEDDDEDEAET
jgi:hypothetical protein